MIYIALICQNCIPLEFHTFDNFELAKEKLIQLSKEYKFNKLNFNGEHINITKENFEDYFIQCGDMWQLKDKYLLYHKRGYKQLYIRRCLY